MRRRDVTLDREAYELLRSYKLPGEPFSDVIKKMSREHARALWVTIDSRTRRRLTNATLRREVRRAEDAE